MTGAVFRQGFWDLGRSVERRGLRSTSDGATNPEPKRPAEKNGRSEERPSSGRKRPGRAAASQSGIAIPRCNNMKMFLLVCKAQSITVLDKTPQKDWKKLS